MRASQQITSNVGSSAGPETTTSLHISTTVTTTTTTTSAPTRRTANDPPSKPASDPARRHPASLIPRNLHDPILLGLLRAPVNEELIDYVAECTLAVVSTSEDDNLSELPTPPTTPIKSTHRKPPSSNRSTTTSSLHTSSSSLVPSLNTFIKLTSNRANAQAPTLLVTLVYLDRLRLRLKGAKAAKGMQCTYHRLFLACLMAAAKYCNDCCPRNVHWSKWSAIFTLNEVNLMEQELLMLLDYDLRADEKSLIEMCAPFFPTPSPSTTSTSTTAPMPPSSNSASSVVSSPSSKSSKFSLAGSSPSSYRSSYTSSTSASEALTPHSTVTPALITITSAPHHSPHCPLPSSSSSASKRARLDIGAGLLPVAVISRAKSWYGNLRNSS